MIIENIALKDTHQFSDLFMAYLNNEIGVSGLYAFRPEWEVFKQAIDQRSFPEENRSRLVEILNEQYSKLPDKKAVSDQIQLLQQPKTFTVTTGHQLNIFTGPLYFIYKLVSTINLARKLQQQYPAYHFVPVYWMASEDHDFEEINHLQLFGKTYTWDRKAGGPVGRMSTEGLPELIGQLPEPVPLFEHAYKNYHTLAAATRAYVHELFGDRGLVVIDADDSRLKRSFHDVMLDDLTDHTANQKVEQTNQQLEQNGYKSQVFPREINLFYMEDGVRERIVQEGDRYTTTGGLFDLDSDGIRDLLEESPEAFSPNVVLRPLYQETILPNLAYLGGPAEVTYWLQLKPVFEHYHLFYPMLLPRNFALVINKNNHRKLSKLSGITARDLFQDIDRLKQLYLDRQELTAFSLENERRVGNELFRSLENKAIAIDASLKGFIGAEKSKFFKLMGEVESRIKKSAEKREETALRQLAQLKEKLFPGGVPQERVENMLNIYLNHPGFIDDLVEHFDPLNFSYYLFVENE